jgi:hypothetical protein
VPVPFSSLCPRMGSQDQKAHVESFRGRAFSASMCHPQLVWSHFTGGLALLLPGLLSTAQKAACHHQLHIAAGWLCPPGFTVTGRLFMIGMWTRVLLWGILCLKGH